MTDFTAYYGIYINYIISILIINDATTLHNLYSITDESTKKSAVHNFVSYLFVMPLTNGYVHQH